MEFPEDANKIDAMRKYLSQELSPPNLRSIASRFSDKKFSILYSHFPLIGLEPTTRERRVR
jgi:hypothetical protein